MSVIVKKYIGLIKSFTEGGISAAEFEKSYLAMFKNETSVLSEEEYQILDRLFSSVDLFCEDESIRDEDDLDEEKLLSDAESAVLKLEKLSGN